ncbi:uncharacterized protein I303_102071 [Kwoniella dejecticola CBS 10117]|uniref:Nucleoporin Nup54 alpha-helical domain-containing protein n=1 Tax=Kwoniella dejecticola CBS 10117 TaxID=1296121 RepID=A0A1A6AC02_9TREE|nr:uncharacterized protein I303_01788 [Kwoniella dejecticola CBS 10117]OBR87580.1 hypothetical protein I303_01788 [Kwoniella dejecticola CBS 10117]
MSFGFGSSSAAKPAFGGFSTPNPQASSSGPSTSLFGAAPAQPAGSSTSLFGSTNPQPQQQQQQPAAGGGLFGSTTNQPSGTSGGTSLFGSTSQPQGGGGLFGSTVQQPQQQQGGGLFGNTSTSGTGSSTGGLFGSANANANQPAGTGAAGGSSLFGGGGAKPAGSGLFGSTTTAQPASGTGGSLFGQHNAQQSGRTGLFGSTTGQQPQQTQQGGSSLFGGGSTFGQQSQSQTQNKPAGSLFGGGAYATTQTSQPQQFSTFATGINNPQPQQQQQPSIFGQSMMNNTNTNMNASTSANPFGVKQGPDIETRIKQIQGAWDGNSPDCRFKYFFFNVVEEGTAGRYGRPAGASDDAKWAKALRDNPDPNSMVPVLATGWADVKKREQQQENLASVHQQRVKELQAALSHTRQTSLSASIRLSNLQAQQTQLLHRLIHVVSQTPQYVPLIQSSAFKQEEADMQRQLESVKAELEGKGRNTVKPSHSSSHGLGLNNGRSTPVNSSGGVGANKGRLLGQVNELWGHLEEIRRRRKMSRNGNDSNGHSGEHNWLADEKALAEVAEILSTQQMALQKLSGLVHDGLEDSEVIRHGLGMVSSQER